MQSSYRYIWFDIAIIIKYAIITYSMFCYCHFQARENMRAWSEILSSSHSQLQIAVETFTSSLEQVAMATRSHGEHMTDNNSYHHWVLPRNTGLDSDWSKSCTSCMCGTVFFDKNLKYSYMGKKDDSFIKNECSKIPNGPCKIMDSYPAMMNAFKTGMSITCLILGIQHSVTDTN